MSFPSHVTHGAETLSPKDTCTEKVWPITSQSPTCLGNGRTAKNWPWIKLNVLAPVATQLLQNPKTLSFSCLTYSVQ